MNDFDLVEHYKISSDRLHEISAAAGMDVLRVRTICTYPWPEPKLHQQWLDEASVEEIAHWVRFIARLEDEESSRSS